MVENLLERLLIFDINSFKPSIHTLFPTVFYDTYLVGVFTFLPEYLTCDTIKFWSNYWYIGWSIHYLFHETMDVILPLLESLRFF